MTGIVLLGLRILAAIALYAFLARVLFFLWGSLRQTQFIASLQTIPLDLLVSAPEEEDKILHFNQNDITLGRDPDCDCVLPHTTVSARHARLAYHHTQWWLDDLFSTNGTKLNDEPLQTPTVVVNGDTIKCGQVSVTLLINDENMKPGAK